MTLLLVVCLACGKAEDQEPPAPVETYTVRGQVVTLPPDIGGEIRLAHEALDDFVAADGTVVGMDAMTMSFPMREGVDATALAVGDIVEFDLRVDWSSEDLATVIRIESLPAETELVFGSASPSGNDG